jgi:hypothetical protein
MNLCKNLGKKEWSGTQCENLLYAAARAPTKKKFDDAMLDIRRVCRGRLAVLVIHYLSLVLTVQLPHVCDDGQAPTTT